jgi:hypothetical protein
MDERINCRPPKYRSNDSDQNTCSTRPKSRTTRKARISLTSQSGMLNGPGQTTQSLARSLAQHRRAWHEQVKRLGRGPIQPGRGGRGPLRTYWARLMRDAGRRQDAPTEPGGRPCAAPAGQHCPAGLATADGAPCPAGRVLLRLRRGGPGTVHRAGGAVLRGGLSAAAGGGGTARRPAVGRNGVKHAHRGVDTPTGSRRNGSGRRVGCRGGPGGPVQVCGPKSKRDMTTMSRSSQFQPLPPGRTRWRDQSGGRGRVG